MIKIGGLAILTVFISSSTFAQEDAGAPRAKIKIHNRSYDDQSLTDSEPPRQPKNETQSAKAPAVPAPAPKVQPVAAEKRSSPTSPTSYPQFTLGIGYRPSLTGINESINSSQSTVKISGYSFTGFYGNLGWAFSPRFEIGIDAEYYNLSKQAEDLATYTLDASNASVFAPALNFRYCVGIGESSTRLCPRVFVGMDSFLILQPSTGTALDLAALNDTMIGGGLDLDFQLLSSVFCSLNARYAGGLSQSQSGLAQLSNSSKFAGDLNFDYIINSETKFRLGFGYADRLANFTVSGQQWTSETTTVSVSAGIQWNL